MIFVLGGLIILVISFVVAFVSLVREQKTQSHQQADIEDRLSVKEEDKQKSITEISVPVISDIPEVGEPKTEDEIKSIQKEEAYRILQSRVQKMTESEARGDRPFDSVEKTFLEEQPETNIEDPMEGDLALSQKVPLPWEDNAEQVPELKLDYQIPKIDQSDQSKVMVLPEDNKSADNGDKLTGQINIGDLEEKQS